MDRKVSHFTRRDFLKTSSLALAGPLLLGTKVVRAAEPNSILIRGCRVVDGTGRDPILGASILIEQGRFKEIRRGDIKPAAGARVIDAEGRTLLPGLIDMHAHLLSGGFDTITAKSMSYDIKDQKRALKLMLYWGVTSVFDPVQPLASGLELRAQVAQGVFPSPRLFITGPGITAPGGWAGSTNPDARLDLTNPNDVKAAIARLADAKVDALKVFYDDMGCSFTTTLPKLNLAVMEEVIKQAHARKLKVMVHCYETPDHKAVLRAGVDMLAHSAVTAPVDDEYIALAKKNKTLYLGTLSVYSDVFNEIEIRQLIAQDFVKNTVPKKTLDTLVEGGPLDGFEKSIKQDYFKKQLPLILANMKKLYENGVAIGVGPDTGVPGAFPGIAVHREMELMVRAGIPPSGVIEAATKTGAHYLRQTSLGTIENGKLADAIIVQGDPLTDIKHTRNIEQVIKNGRLVNREKLLEEILMD